MAIASPLNLQQITTGVRSLGVAVTRAQVSANRSAGVLVNRNKIKRKLVFGDRLSFDRRRERVRRRRQEDIIESSSIGGFIKNRGLALANSTRGFLGRIMDFLGTLLVGWLLNNLPTIISMAQELMARIGRLVNILGGFVTNIGKSLQSFGKVLGAVGQNIINFDFLDSNKRVQTAMDDLNSVFDDMSIQIDDGIKLFTTPLGEGLVSGENAAPTGTDYTTQPEVTDTSGTPGTAGKLQPIHKQALDIISKPESGGDYNAMNRGTAADSLGGSKKWIGKNLTDMTIGEVISLQSQGKLHAAGRYQFVPRSLPTAKASAGLKDTDRFDKNNQDLLAIGLLKTQGPGAWTPYSKYSKKEIDIMYKAKDTPLGAATPAAPAQITPIPGKGISTTVRDEINVSGPSGGTQTVGLSGGKGEFGAPRTGRKHEGIDIGTSGARGYYVSFKKSGKVVFAAVAGGYGNTVDIITSDGTCYRFAHLAKMMVRNGESYNGQTIGEIGNTGSSPDIHLHYEVRPGGPYATPINPRPYLNLLSIGRQLTGVAGQPAQIAAPTPAQIAAQPSQRRQQLSSQVTPQRVGQKIVIIDNMQPPQISSAPPSGGGSMGFIPIQTNSLNSYITKKLLLDLAYT